MTVLGGVFKNIVRGGPCALRISNRMTVAMYLCDIFKRNRTAGLLKSGWWWTQSQANPSPPNSLLNREKTGNFCRITP